MSSDKDEWDRLEYEQASDDFRFYNQTAWQATVAVLIGDGVVVGTIASLQNVPTWLGLVPAGVGLLTLLMGLQTSKCRIRSNNRRAILEERDKVRYQEGRPRRFYPRETGITTWRIGMVLEALMFVTAFLLFIYSGYLVYHSFATVCQQ
jgi:hypothetical protein